MATHHLILTLTTIIAILLVGGNTSHSLQAFAQQQHSCSTTDGVAVLLGCLNFIKKDGPRVPPSSNCCGAVKTIGMNCTCKIITKDIEATISMEKLVSVAKSCGQPLAPGTQCGSYKVPKA